MYKTDSLGDVGFLGLLPLDCRATRVPVWEGQCLKSAEGSFEMLWKHVNVNIVKRSARVNRDFDHLLVIPSHGAGFVCG